MGADETNAFDPFKQNLEKKYDKQMNATLANSLAQAKVTNSSS